jgi:hypothetical protein
MASSTRLTRRARSGERSIAQLIELDQESSKVVLMALE